MYEVKIPPLREHPAKKLAFVRGPKPEYRFHYFGPANHPDTLAKYRRFGIAYLERGGWPEDFFHETYKRVPAIADMTAAFRGEVGDKPGQKEDHYIATACRILDELFADKPIAEFTGRDLQTAFRFLAKSGNYNRSTINKTLSSCKRLFRFGVMAGIVPPDVFSQVCALEGFRRGQIPEMAEPEKRMPVDFETVEATCEHLPQVLRDVVMVLWHTGARPSEVLPLRPMDINREGDVWFAGLAEHKTMDKGKARIIHFGPQSQAILRGYLLRDADKPLFSPKEAMAQRYAERQTHRHQPVEPPSTERRLGDCYDANGLRKAIEYACKAAGVEVWTPYRLRHSFATRCRAEMGIESAQIALGHSDPGMTLTYAQADMKKAQAVAQAMG